jgi:hypothetical protein
MVKYYWNNEEVSISGVNYLVTQSGTPLHWQNLHVGSTRQGIKIQYCGTSFVIDNENGDGYRKITKGRGSLQYSHKSVDNPNILSEISDNEIIKEINIINLLKENQSHDEFMEKENPEIFKIIKELRDLISKNK